jgi:hypothetical protein
MVLYELWDFFEKWIFTIRSTPGFFNQYRDRHSSVDLAEATAIRQQNLLNYFLSFSKIPPVLLLGEAPGPWGCRFSGIPFTGERQLLDQELPFSGQQSSRGIPRIKVRKTTPYISNSARVFWSTMLPYYPRFIVWNCVPIHPYRIGNILSVRTPTSKEVVQYSYILLKILSILKPDRIVAVGRKAQYSLTYLGETCSYVRHPSQGGTYKFKRGIKKAFGVL